MMAQDLARACTVHSDRFDCPDALMYADEHGPRGLIVHDGSSSFIEIAFCPWCGTKLDSGLRQA
jgi:hypothetical protein